MPRILAAVAQFFGPVEYSEGTAFCFDCADVYADGEEHVCPPSVIEGQCCEDDCDGGRADRFSRCLRCGSSSFRVRNRKLLGRN